MIIDGPPFSSGRIHYGTLYNKYLKTLFSRINGKDSFKFFFDTHGLPIENKVPRNSSWKSYYTLAEENTETMINDLKKYGIVPESSEMTCSLSYSKEVWAIFSKLVNKDLVYQKDKILLFCPSCNSICSNNELEIKEVETKACYFKFYSSLNPDLFFLIYTTQPWTLNYNEAIAYNPEKEYYQSSTGLIASKTYFMKNNLEGNLISLTDLTYFDKGICKKLYASNKVESTKGTGLVHQSPNYGLVDYQIFGESSQEVDLKYDGTFKSHKLDYKQLSEKYLTLEQCYTSEVITHIDQSCWRCKTPCLRKRIRTIFLKTKLFKDQVLSWISEDKYSIYPKTVENKFIDWLNNIEDWGIARQRSWGIQIPLWINSKKNTLLTLSAEEYQKITMKKLEIADFHSPLKKITINNESYEPLNQIFDVWFDSACLPIIIKQKKQVAIESIDQIRGWFYGTCIISSMISEEPPWKQTFCHGYLLRTKKEKFSKSNNDLDLASLSLLERRQLLFYLSNREPWKNSVFDIKENKKTNKALSILDNLFKVSLSNSKDENYDFRELEKLVRWFVNLEHNFKDISSKRLVNYIINFSRSYVNKNKGYLDKKLVSGVLRILQLICQFILLEEKNYPKIKKEIVEIYSNLIIHNGQ